MSFSARDFNVKVKMDFAKLRELVGNSTRNLKRRIERSFYQSAYEEVFLKSVQNLSPMDTGALRDSAKFDVSYKPNSLEITISYNEPYAAYVHHGIVGKVTWTTPGTGRDYLARPLFEFAATMNSHLARNFEGVKGIHLKDKKIASGTYYKGYSRRTGKPA